MLFGENGRKQFLAGRRPGLRSGGWSWIGVAVVLWSAGTVRAQVTFAGTQFGIASESLHAPASVAADGKGNVYIADTGNNRVVEVSPSGTGYGAPVTILSGLSAPGGVASDWSGNLFISDTGNGRILKLPVTATGYGAMVTVAEGLNSPAGLALDSSSDVYVADPGDNSILEILFASGVYQAPVAIGTGFSHPMGVALDANRDVYIADTGNNRVVEAPLSSAGYVTVRGLWSSLNAPMGLGVDGAGDVYIAVNGGQEVLENPWSAGAKRFNNRVTIGTGLSAPAGVAIGVSGKVFIADAGSNQVWAVQAVGLDFGATGVGVAESSLTYNFSIGAGTVLSGVGILTQGASGNDFTDGGASTCMPQTFAIATSCGVNVSFKPMAAGARMGSVVLWGSTGSPLATAYISGVGTLPKIGFIPGTITQLGSQLSGPTGVAVDGQGDVYISDSGNNRVVELPWTGSGYGMQTVVPMNGLLNPMGLSIDGAGNLYVVSNGNDKVIYLPWTPNGFGTQSKVGSGLYGPSNVAVGANGTVFITDTLNQRLDDIPWTGNAYMQESTVGIHRAPIGVTVDSAGSLYFTDPYENQISKLVWAGTHFLDQLLIPVRGMSFPYGVATDANEDLFILDAVNNDVVMLPWNGTSYGEQITVANGFNSPSGLAIDSNGVLYVADTGNNQVVKIDMSSPGGMSYASTYLGSTSADSPQGTYLGNLGNMPISLETVSYPADFPEGTAGSDGCAAEMTLSPSAWCELAVNFTPSAVSPLLSETVTVTDDSLGIAENQQQIAVSGVSLAKASQTINFTAPAGAVYGAAPLALAATATSGLPVAFSVMSGPGTLTSNGKLLRFSGVGTVVLQAVQGGNGDFAAAAAVTVTVTVAPATLTVTPRHLTVTYGAIPASFAYSLTGFVNGDSAQIVSGAPLVSGTMNRSAAVGSYVLNATQGTLSAANYIFAFATGTLTVNPAILQVEALSQSTLYGKSYASLQWSLRGFVNGDGRSAVTGAPVLTTAANSGSAVGQYPISASLGTLNSANYTFSFLNGTLTVNPAMLTVTATNQSISYGEPVPALSYSISGFVNGDAQATTVHGSAVVTTIASQKPGAGVYALTATQGSLSAGNYSFAFVSGVLSVQKAVLQVNPANTSMTYGSAMPKFTYTMAGFVNGDSAGSAVSGLPALIGGANSRSTPGTYAIHAALGTLAARNYSFSFGGAQLTVEKALLTVTAKPASMIYGGKLPEMVLGYVGFVNGDSVSSLTGAISVATQATNSSPVGTYPIAVSLGTLDSQKYTFNFENASLSVTPAVLIVEAQAATMTYGAKVPALTYAMRGFVNGDTAAEVSGTPAMQSAASAAASVGTYPITLTAGTLKAANYTFTMVGSSVSVTKAVLAVLPGDVTMTYGSALPQLGVSFSGLLNGDTVAGAVLGTPQLATTATSSSAVGSYAVSAGLGSLAAKNYSFQFKTGTVAVTKAQLTVTASNCSMTAGGSVPVLSYTVTGFANGDTQATATGGKASLSTSASNTSKAGSYAIVTAQGSLSAKNYAFTFVNGSLTVNQ